jgi:hypothetical protein
MPLPAGVFRLQGFLLIDALPMTGTRSGQFPFALYWFFSSEQIQPTIE